MIGHHLLEGKLVNLPKPLAVLHRNDPPLGGDGAQTRPGEAMEVDEPRDAGSKSWDVVAIVKRKMVFSKRPMPVVGSSGKSSSAAPLSRIGSKA